MIAMKIVACLSLFLLLLSLSLPSSAHEDVLNPLSKVLNHKQKADDLDLFQTRKLRIYNRKRARSGLRPGGRSSTSSAILSHRPYFHVGYLFCLSLFLGVLFDIVII